jgi:hypothetical protein
VTGSDWILYFGEHHKFSKKFNFEITDFYDGQVWIVVLWLVSLNSHVSGHLFIAGTFYSENGSSSFVTTVSNYVHYYTVPEVRSQYKNINKKIISVRIGRKKHFLHIIKQIKLCGFSAKRPGVLVGFSWVSSVSPGKCWDSTLN